MYAKRVKTFLKHYRCRSGGVLGGEDMATLARSVWHLGIRDKEARKFAYWDLLKESATRYRSAFAEVVSMTICGYHFRKLFWSSGDLSTGKEGPLR